MRTSRPNFSTLQHLNGNLLCAVDVETTGTDHDKHDIIEIALLPLDAQYKPNKRMQIFNLTMRPVRTENVDRKALEVNQSTYDEICNNALYPDRVAELFVEWFTKLNLGFNKRISPLAHNWPFDMNFIRDWLGEMTFHQIFDGRYRDLQASCLFANDLADWRGDRIPYPKVNLSYIANELKVNHEDAHQALADCRITAECYEKLMQVEQRSYGMVDRSVIEAANANAESKTPE